jgi:citrate lyase subunit beta / citryl-CoA lyase
VTARSYLFVPANRPELMRKALASSADAVVLDLEDSIPADEKDSSRAQAHEILSGLDQAARSRLWVRPNGAGTPECNADLAMLAGSSVGVRLPKVDSVADLEWVASRLPGSALIATVETAAGLVAASDLAGFDGVVRLALGGLDLIHDLGCVNDPSVLVYARSAVVVASRAAGLPGPINSVYPVLDDEDGLRRHVRHAADLGFRAQSVLSPRQLGVVHEVYRPDEKQLAWATQVLRAFEDSGGQATRSSLGEFVDLPVARRAAEIMAQHCRSD